VDKDNNHNIECNICSQKTNQSKGIM